MASLQGKSKEVRLAATKVNDVSALELGLYFHGQAYDWGLREFYGYLAYFCLFSCLAVMWKVYNNLKSHLTAHGLVSVRMLLFGCCSLVFIWKERSDHGSLVNLAQSPDLLPRMPLPPGSLCAGIQNCGTNAEKPTHDYGRSQ